jgi:squalene-hopene/tetraprenyl-beta-curcumene cyclase
MAQEPDGGSVAAAVSFAASSRSTGRRSKDGDLAAVPGSFSRARKRSAGQGIQLQQVRAAMTLTPSSIRSALVAIVVVLASSSARADGEALAWKPAAAARYLDEREDTWFAFALATRGEGTAQSSCISCHSVLPYIFARPVLRKRAGSEPPTKQEQKLLAQTRNRVSHWKNLDTEEFGLLYDFNDRKKTESWGTEAILNAVVLGFDDRTRGRSSPSDETKQAFAHLWERQLQTGNHKGAWDWLDFSFAPWEAKDGAYYGAALAAIAVGSAPGYFTPGADAALDAKVESLRKYLRDQLPKQNLHNQVWGLWAAATVEGISTKAERQSVIGHLLGKQRADGGWSLPSLGAWVRSDHSEQDAESDGYATGLVLHVLQTAGVPKGDAKVARGLNWLAANQAASGAWRSVSVNKKRDPASHAGKFMSDAATAYAVLALSH